MEVPFCHLYLLDILKQLNGNFRVLTVFQGSLLHPLIPELKDIQKTLGGVWIIA